jgi:hypothetical protein
MSIYSHREFNYPHLLVDNHQVTSDSSNAYNCIAWAVGENDRRWEPSDDPTDAYWPPDIPREDTLEAFIRVFTDKGYEICQDGSLEPGFEKVAIYADREQMFTHVAKQESDGRWTSKMGDWEDIEHSSPEVIEGRMCGTVAFYLRHQT